MTIATLSVVALVAGAGFMIVQANRSSEWDRAAARYASYSMKTYQSVSELSVAADAAVVGEIVDSGRKSWDHGLDAAPTDGAPNPSLPVLVYKFAVHRIVGARVTVPSVVDIVVPGNAMEGVTRFTNGESLLIFLNYVARTGVDGLTEAWVPVSYDNGEFDVAGSRLEPRSANITTLSRGQLGPFTATVSDVESVVKAVGTKGILD